MEVRKICQWCGKPFIAKKTTTCYCSHQCSNLGYKERIRERKRQMRKMQELLQPKQAAEGQDFFSFAQAAKLMGGDPPICLQTGKGIKTKSIPYQWEEISYPSCGY